eukprot:TRINITY_DN24178_c0_g1_i2.p1 TRINITY_DN24178_c0_g1~~TRINITY_DN24178_c0_g1_i2.p1  ORF type:complete len:643 (+),score=82.21 TRINITY_DN24178_c0_g1_i2:272-2200(+)
MYGVPPQGLTGGCGSYDAALQGLPSYASGGIGGSASVPGLPPGTASLSNDRIYAGAAQFDRAVVSGAGTSPAVAAASTASAASSGLQAGDIAKTLYDDSTSLGGGISGLSGAGGGLGVGAASYKSLAAAAQPSSSPSTLHGAGITSYSTVGGGKSSASDGLGERLAERSDADGRQSYIRAREVPAESIEYQFPTAGSFVAEPYAESGAPTYAVEYHGGAAPTYAGDLHHGGGCPANHGNCGATRTLPHSYPSSGGIGTSSNMYQDRSVSPMGGRRSVSPMYGGGCAGGSAQDLGCGGGFAGCSGHTNCYANGNSPGNFAFQPNTYANGYTNGHYSNGYNTPSNHSVYGAGDPHYRLDQYGQKAYGPPPGHSHGYGPSMGAGAGGYGVASGSYGCGGNYGYGLGNSACGQMGTSSQSGAGAFNFPTSGSFIAEPFAVGAPQSMMRNNSFAATYQGCGGNASDGAFGAGGLGSTSYGGGGMSGFGFNGLGAAGQLGSLGGTNSPFPPSQPSFLGGLGGTGASFSGLGSSASGMKLPGDLPGGNSSFLATSTNSNGCGGCGGGGAAAGGWGGASDADQGRPGPGAGPVRGRSRPPAETDEGNRSSSVRPERPSKGSGPGAAPSAASRPTSEQPRVKKKQASRRCC